MCERSGDVESIRLTKTWDKVNESLDGETWRCCRRVGELISRIESNVTRWGANVEWPKKKKKLWAKDDNGVMTMIELCVTKHSECPKKRLQNHNSNKQRKLFFFFFGERSNSIANRYIDWFLMTNESTNEIKKKKIPSSSHSKISIVKSYYKTCAEENHDRKSQFELNEKFFLFSPRRWMYLLYRKRKMQMMKRGHQGSNEELAIAHSTTISRANLIRHRDDHRQLWLLIVANIISGNPM